MKDWELALAGGIAGGIGAFVIWCVIVDHQLKRASRRD